MERSVEPSGTHKSRNHGLGKRLTYIFPGRRLGNLIAGKPHKRREREPQEQWEVWLPDGTQLPLTAVRPSQSPPKSAMDRQAIERRIAKVPFWWHYIDLGNGVVTPGNQWKPNCPWATQRVREMLQLPESLAGKTVLDIGAWDGYFAFEAERRGASRVLAIDNFYRFDESLADQGFNVAKKILGSKAEFRKMDVYDLSPDKVEMFDVVLFLGVIYHLRHPVLALEKVASVTKEMMILESQFTQDYGGEPVARFLEGDELNKDSTNWWVPTRACLEAMIRSAGFGRAEFVCNSAGRIVIKGYK